VANTANTANTANNEQGNEIARYAYDPFGRRIKKTVSQTPSGQGSTGTTLYFYADEGLIAEVDGNSSGGNITTTYGWMPNNTWGTAPQWKRDHAGQSGATNPQGDASTNGVEHYYHVDHLGTSQRLTNAQGETTWRMVSEAFGKTFVDTTLAPTTTGTTTNNFRFPGQYEDVETATHYNFMRTYLPMVGRYVESDPIGLGGGVNTFSYVGGTPLSLTDPLGLWAWGDPVDQDIADAVTGFGDSIISTLTFGGLSGQGLRDGLDIGGGVNKCSRFYMGGRVAGTTATLLANATGAIPKALTHFTTQAGARGIAQSGIRASRGGLFGGGRYTSSVGPFPRNPFVPPRSTVGVAINNTAGYVRAVPGTFLNPTAAGAAQLGAMNAAYGAAANRDMFDQKCGCENQ
jgi:RHS repeat-associated protein